VHIPQRYFRCSVSHIKTVSSIWRTQLFNLCWFYIVLKSPDIPGISTASLQHNYFAHSLICVVVEYYYCCAVCYSCTVWLRHWHAVIIIATQPRFHRLGNFMGLPFNTRNFWGWAAKHEEDLDLKGGCDWIRTC